VAIGARTSGGVTKKVVDTNQVILGRGENGGEHQTKCCGQNDQAIFCTRWKRRKKM